jgi:hypothetical protein
MRASRRAERARRVHGRRRTGKLLLEGDARRARVTLRRAIRTST